MQLEWDERYLPDVIGHSVQQTLANILWRELPLFLALLEHLSERTSDHRRFESEFAVILSIDILDKHVHGFVITCFGKSKHFCEKPKRETHSLDS